MVFKKDQFNEAVKKAVTDTKAQPSSGKVCAIASLRTVRDNLIDDLFGKEIKPEDEGIVAAIKESFLELIKAINKDGAENGFCSNASAAAKAAGFKAGTAEIVEIED